MRDKICQTKLVTNVTEKLTFHFISSFAPSVVKVALQNALLRWEEVKEISFCGLFDLCNCLLE